MRNIIEICLRKQYSSLKLKTYTTFEMYIFKKKNSYSILCLLSSADSLNDTIPKSTHRCQSLITMVKEDDRGNGRPGWRK